MRLVPAIVVRVFALLALVLDGPLYAQDTVPQVDPDLTHKEHAQAHWMTAAVQRRDCKKPIEARIGDTPLDRSKAQDLGAGSFG